MCIFLGHRELKCDGGGQMNERGRKQKDKMNLAGRMIVSIVCKGTFMNRVSVLMKVCELGSIWSICLI
jgi:hypothetical protein